MFNLDVLSVVILALIFISGFMSALVTIEITGRVRESRRIKKEQQEYLAAAQMRLFGKVITLSDVRTWSAEKKVADKRRKSNELQIPKCVQRKKSKSHVKSSNAYARKVKKYMGTISAERSGKYDGATREDRWKQWSEKRSSQQVAS